MTSLWNVLMAFFVMLDAGVFLFCLFIYFRTEPNSIPTKTSKKAYVIYQVGQWFFYSLVASAILGLAILFILWVANNIKIIG